MTSILYFPAPGRAEASRLALVEAGVECNNEFVGDWPAQKAAGLADGSLPFGQVPMLRDDDGPIVQSKAILRHLGRKYKLYGTTEREHSLVDMALDEQETWRADYGKLVWVDGKAPEAVAAYKAKVLAPTGYVPLMEAFLKRNPAGPAFLAGASLTIADLDLWDLLDQQLPLIPDLLADAPHLAALYKAVAERPKIKAYLDSKPAHRPAQ